LPEHFWYGYKFTTNADYIADVIVLRRTTEQLPTKGFHIFLLEAFLSDKQVLELDLVCEYNGKEHFACVRNGKNVHYFSMPVKEGRRYQREIQFGDNIRYILSDIATGNSEIFTLPIKSARAIKSFRGVEWHGTVMPFPLKFDVFSTTGLNEPATLSKDTSKVKYPIYISPPVQGALFVKNKVLIAREHVIIAVLVIAAAIMLNS
jgi:hypothetical protein